MGIERTWKTIVFLGVIFVGSVLRVAGQGNDSLVNVSPRKFVHGLRVEGRPEYIFPTSSFLKGANAEGRIIRGAFSTHLKYLFRYRPGSVDERIYGDVYQGIGLGFYDFGNPGSWETRLHFICSKGLVSLVWLPGCLYITSGILGCPRGGNLMTRIIIRTIR